MRTHQAVREFLLDCEARNLRPTSRHHYQWALRRLAVHCRNLPKRGRDLRPVYAAEGLGHTSVQNLDKALRRFFKWCQREYGHRDPTQDLDRIPPRRTLPRILTPVELAALWDAAGSRRDQALIAVILDSGIRIGELAALRWPDVGPDSLMVEGKRGRRQVPVSPQTKRLMLGLGDGYHIWVGRLGPMTYQGIETTYRRLFRRANIVGRKTGPHTLRHTFATMYIDAGGNVRKLQEILGHSDLSTTMVYVHLAGLDVKADHARYSPIHTLPLEAYLA